jgi:hypothetical protein
MALFRVSPKIRIYVRLQGAVLLRSIGRPVAAITEAVNEHRRKCCNAAIGQALGLKDHFWRCPLGNVHARHTAPSGPPLAIAGRWEPG